MLERTVSWARYLLRYSAHFLVDTESALVFFGEGESRNPQHPHPGVPAFSHEKRGGGVAVGAVAVTETATALQKFPQCGYCF